MKLTWTVTISIDDVWIREGWGFQVTTRTIQEALKALVPSGYEEEITITILKKPDPKLIAQVRADEPTYEG